MICENQSLTLCSTYVGQRKMNQPHKQISLNRTVKSSFGIVTLLCFVLMASLQSAEPWKPLFNGKDFTGWTVSARGGLSLNPADAGWKMDNGIVVGGQAGRDQRGASLVWVAALNAGER